MKNAVFLFCFTLCFASLSLGQEFVFKANYDEQKVPQYQLPDPLEGVKGPGDWKAKRKHWYGLLSEQMFGKTPQGHLKTTVRSAAKDKTIMDDQCLMRQIVVQIAGVDANVILFLPKAVKQPVPVFLGYNFGGNHSVLNDPSIVLPNSWMRKAKDNEASSADRGKASGRWAIERIVDAGFGLVTLYYGDIDPDFDDGFKNGVHAKLGVPHDDQAASIATWAWALSRVLDVLDETKEVDGSRVAVIGHSRLGKTSLWAGASDPRFALVISNNSGCGGAALSRRMYGETLWRINNSFPHWFCRNFHKYGNHEDSMPFDNHVLLALIAPRPLYVASAVKDRWADPKGEFLSCLHADPVYKLLGTEGLPATSMPEVDQPVQGMIGYHVRSGGHDVTDYDWQQYIQFATKHLVSSSQSKSKAN